MDKQIQRLKVSRNYEVPLPPVVQRSEFDMTEDLKHPKKFVASGLGIGFYLLLASLPLGFVAVPALFYFWRFLGIQ